MARCLLALRHIERRWLVRRHRQDLVRSNAMQRDASRSHKNQWYDWVLNSGYPYYIHIHIYMFIYIDIHQNYGFMTGLTNKRGGLTNKNKGQPRKKERVLLSKHQNFKSMTVSMHTLDVTNCRVVQSPSSTLCRKHIMFAEVVLRKLSPVSFLKEGF